VRPQLRGQERAVEVQRRKVLLRGARAGLCASVDGQRAWDREARDAGGECVRVAADAERDDCFAGGGGGGGAWGGFTEGLVGVEGIRGADEVGGEVGRARRGGIDGRREDGGGFACGHGLRAVAGVAGGGGEGGVFGGAAT